MKVLCKYNNDCIKYLKKLFKCLRLGHVKVVSALLKKGALLHRGKPFYSNSISLIKFNLFTRAFLLRTK